MYHQTEVPDAYRRYFFVNDGGPLRKILNRQVVEKKWQLVLLDCGDRVLIPGYVKSPRRRCGFCGGLQPLAAFGSV